MKINKKLFAISMIIAVPLIAMVLYLITMLNNFSLAYNQNVRNITEANTYNIYMKQQIDYGVYRIIIGTETFESARITDDIEDPYKLINETIDAFEYIQENTTGMTNKAVAESIVKIMRRLENCIEDIEMDLDKSPQDKTKRTYDENIEYLKYNVYNLTSNAQNQIQTYIYNEATNFESIRTELEEQVNNAIQVSLTAVSLMVVVIIIVVLFITRSIARPLVLLSKAAEKVGQGDFDVWVTTNSRGGEIGVLADSFNHMTEEIERLVDNVQIEQKNLRVTELKLMQAQINPHFLYNTLDNIVWLVEGGRNKDAISMTVSLSQFFRIVLSQGKDFITIEDEMRHIRSYLEIQQFRYQDILEYDIQVEREIYCYSILKMTLQPLVENALYHGIKNQREKGIIKVTGKREGAIIYFDISDNGAGMTQEELLQLRKKIKRERSDQVEGFGLINVEERLRLNFGREYGLWVESEEGVGTTVSVRIPVKSSLE